MSTKDEEQKNRLLMLKCQRETLCTKTKKHFYQIMKKRTVCWTFDKISARRKSYRH